MIQPEMGYANLLGTFRWYFFHGKVVFGPERLKINYNENRPPSSRQLLTRFLPCRIFRNQGYSQEGLGFERRAGARILRVTLLGSYSGRAVPRLFKTVAAFKPDVVGDLYEN